MNSLRRTSLAAALFALTIPIGFAPAAPTIFSDDFQTLTTYNHQTYIDACASTIPDWSIQNVLADGTYYERAVAGGGQLRISNWEFSAPNPSFDDLKPLGEDGWGMRMDVLFVGWAGGIIGCPGEPDVGETNQPFDQDNLCIFGGFQLNRFQLSPFYSYVGPLPDIGPLESTQYGRQFASFDPTTATIDQLDLYRPGEPRADDDGNGLTDDDPNCGVGQDLQPGLATVDDDGNAITDDIRELYWCGCGTACLLGTDGQPGVANVDDDIDGLIDEWDERCPEPRSGSFQASDDFYCPDEVDDQFVFQGRPSPEYLHMGSDNAPGDAGVDDDGNGITDVTDVPGILGIDDDRDGTTDEPGQAGVDDDGDGVTDESFEPGEFQFDMAEYGMGTDGDTDDISGEWAMAFAMRMNISQGDFIGLFIEPENDFTRLCRKTTFM